jgi:hypothetical protein
MSRRNLTLPLTCIIASVLFSAVNSNAFRPDILRPHSALPQESRDDDRKVVILDNDYLDRRFGGDRGSDVNSNESANSLPGQHDSVKPRKAYPAAAAPAIPASPNSSLLTGINRGTPARRAAALRLAEVGRTLLQDGHIGKAIYYLEKALSVEANPFIHYYLARAHFQVADYQGSMRFLEVAEAGVHGWPEWTKELAALRIILTSSAAPQDPAPRRHVAWTFNQ